ncbi:MAG: hypothetical protein KDA97_13115 [Acidimicrobiales bacterium]|nr:hypothetical protein [Acidimicrobiales bacterium]
MASSSSAKKVARVAAKSGSGSPGPASSDSKRNWTFALAIVGILALGIGIVAFARDRNQGLGDNSEAPKANLADGEPFDHWHAAFAVEVCGNEVTALQDGVTDPLGIHTHGDGLIHIHPFSRTAAGTRATLQRFFDQVNFVVTDDGFELPAGTTVDGEATTVIEGETTCGGEPGEVILAKWEVGATAEGTEPDEIIREGFGDVRFTEDLAAYTLAFVPEGSTDVDAPSTSSNIAELGAADGGATPTGDGSTSESTETVPVETDDTGGEGG